MTQMTFGRERAIGYAGKIADNSPVIEILSKKAVLPIEFGRKMSYADNDATKVDTICTNKVELKNSGNLDASDTYSFTIKTNDNSTNSEVVTNITTTFDTDHATTMGAIVTQLEAIASIDDSKTLFDSANNKLVIAVLDGYSCEVSSEATGGGSAVTITKENYDMRKQAGISGFKDKEPFDDGNGNEISRWKTNEIVKDIRKGNVIVESPSGFNAVQQLYYVGYGTNKGMVTTTKGNNGILATDIEHRQSATANDRGIVQVKL